jgi:hypothetical protein
MARNASRGEECLKPLSSRYFERACLALAASGRRDHFRYVAEARWPGSTEDVASPMARSMLRWQDATRVQLSREPQYPSKMTHFPSAAVKPVELHIRIEAEHCSRA